MNFEHWNKYVADTIRQLKEEHKKEAKRGGKTAATKGGQKHDDRNSKSTAPEV